MGNHFRSSRFNQAYLARVVNAVRGDAPQAYPAQAPRQPVARSTGSVARTIQAGGVGSVLEVMHPDIAKAITLLWGYPEMNEYFDRLWLADSGSRPIDPDAMSELMLLARVHQHLVPARPRRQLADLYGGSKLYDAAASHADVWSDVPRRR